MESKDLVKLLESILFLAGDGISKSDIIGHFDITDQDIVSAIEVLKKKYNHDSGVNIIEFKNKIQFCSNPEQINQVSEILNPIREKSLTRAALETVAIIAYKQPITRLEIENVRGVNSDYAIDLLQQNNLIEVVGRRDTIGKPLLFGTSESFLKRFGIKDIAELPKYDELIARIKIINKSDSLYREFDIDNTPIDTLSPLEFQQLQDQTISENIDQE